MKLSFLSVSTTSLVLLLAAGSSSNADVDIVVVASSSSSSSSSSSFSSSSLLAKQQQQKQQQQLRLRGGGVDNKRRKLTTTTTTTAVTYPSALPYSSTEINNNNPERGLYVQESYYASKRLATKLDATALLTQQKLSNTGTTIILRLYYLDDFLYSDISQDVLNDITEDFDILRQVGIKAVLRFAYLDTDNNDPNAVTEPTKTQLLSHITQLTPILQSNQNVILSMQAGFIGPWGEWNSSTHFDFDNDNDDNNGYESIKEVLDAILDAVPNRIVQIRTPNHKQQIYSSSFEYPNPPTTGFLINGDFEGTNVESNWNNYNGGYEVTTEEVHSGTQSIKVAMGGAAKQSLSQLNFPAGHTIEISGYSKTSVDGVGTGLGSDYSIYVDLTYDDGLSYGWGETATFTGRNGTSTSTSIDDGWEFASHSIVVPTGKVVTGMSLYTMYRNDNENPNGYVYFDDIEVNVYNGLPTQVSGQVLNSTTAYDGSHISRTGHHNDCFLASDTDYGTYVDSNQSEYQYLSQETQYTAMGGETCAVNPPRSDCTTALYELELFHYTYLNQNYNQEVLAGFESGGCMDEIRSKLGYRLVLLSGEYPIGVLSPGGNLPYKINFVNQGYASPVNPKRVQLVLRETTTGNICATSTTHDDVRRWYGSNTHHSLEGTAVLPNNIPYGFYELLLNIADEDDVLKTNVDFKIKVANDGNLNEVDTGLINLQHSVVVGTGQQPSNTFVTGSSQYAVTCGVEDDILPPPPIITNPDSLVTNGSFEGATTSTNWVSWRNGYELDTTEKNSGSQSIKITSQNTATQGIGGGALQKVYLTTPNVGSTITISGYSKSIGMSQIGVVQGFTGSDYSIYADVKYTDGTYLWGQTAEFTPNSVDWEYQSYSFVVDKDVDYVSLYALYRDDPNTSGVAYFDDIELMVTHPIITDGGFEGNNVQAEWDTYGNEGYTVTTSESYSGAQSVMITNGGARQCIEFEARPGSTIKISGCSKAVGITQGLWDYSIYADVKYTGNTYLWGQMATFPGGTHDWICSEREFAVTKTVESMCVLALYRNDGGTAYFDDVEVTVVN